jgi:hypothetical protein
MIRILLAAIIVIGTTTAPTWAMEDAITYDGTADDDTTIAFMITVDEDELPVMTITDEEDRFIVAAELDFEVSDPYRYPVRSDCGYARILLDQDFHMDASQSEYLDVRLTYHTTIKREKCKYYLDKEKGLQTVVVRIYLADFPVDQVTNLLGAVDGLYREDRQENFDGKLR